MTKKYEQIVECCGNCPSFERRVGDPGWGMCIQNGYSEAFLTHAETINKKCPLEDSE